MAATLKLKLRCSPWRLTLEEYHALDREMDRFRRLLNRTPTPKVRNPNMQVANKINGKTKSGLTSQECRSAIMEVLLTDPDASRAFSTRDLSPLVLPDVNKEVADAQVSSCVGDLVAKGHLVTENKFMKLPGGRSCLRKFVRLPQEGELLPKAQPKMEPVAATTNVTSIEDDCFRRGTALRLKRLQGLLPHLSDQIGPQGGQASRVFALDLITQFDEKGWITGGQLDSARNLIIRAEKTRDAVPKVIKVIKVIKAVTPEAAPEKKYTEADLAEAIKVAMASLAAKRA